MRVKAGLRQSDLANALGVQVSRISRIESGMQGISLDQAEAWAKACGRVVTILGPEHDALLREIAVLDSRNIAIARAVCRVLPTLHDIRKLDLENTVESWRQSSGSVEDDVKTVSRV